MYVRLSARQEQVGHDGKVVARVGRRLRVAHDGAGRRFDSPGTVAREDPVDPPERLRPTPAQRVIPRALEAMERRVRAVPVAGGQEAVGEAVLAEDAIRLRVRVVVEVAGE